jgi:glycerate-2-kinase
VRMQLDPAAYVDRHDAYHFFQATGDLLLTGLSRPTSWTSVSCYWRDDAKRPIEGGES